MSQELIDKFKTYTTGLQYTTLDKQTFRVPPTLLGEFFTTLAKLDTSRIAIAEVIGDKQTIP